MAYDAPLQNIDNFTMSDGKDGNMLVDAIMDYIQNPERSSWYRQNVLFKQNSMPEPFNEPPKELKIVLPLVNLPF